MPDRDRPTDGASLSNRPSWSTFLPSVRPDEQKRRVLDALEEAVAKSANAIAIDLAFISAVHGAIYEALEDVESRFRTELASITDAAYIFDQIEGRTLGISSQSQSIKLAKLVEYGVLVKEGERRGTKYSVAP